MSARKEAAVPTTRSGWCFTNYHDGCTVKACTCDCHGGKTDA